MNTTYFYQTVESTLKIPRMYVGDRIVVAGKFIGHKIVARDGTLAKTDNNAYVHAFVDVNGHVIVDDDAKNWTEHMDVLFLDLAKIATSGKLVVTELPEGCFNPDEDVPRRFTVTPGHLEIEKGFLGWCSYTEYQQKMG